MSLRIAGYAGLFDLPDGARDTIRRGAFARSLVERHEPLPLLWQHRETQRIGSVEFAGEDSRGLRIIARMDNPDSRAVKALLAREARGLSFGYRARRFRFLPQGRLLEDVDLIEVSLVTHPLQHAARVHLVQ